MNLFNRITTFFFGMLIILAGCSTPDIEGFDKEIWMNDRKACNGKRSEQAKILLKNKDQIKGMDDDKVIDLLGKPERTQQFERGKKNFVYYIEPGNQCGTQEKEGKKLVVEINAVGFVDMLLEQDL